MKTIYKYPLEITDRQIIYLPKEAIVLDVQAQKDRFVLWALIDTTKPISQTVIEIYGTGQLCQAVGKYLKTVQTLNDTFVGHVFLEEAYNVEKD